jgi:hypothetical protein
MKKHQNYPIKMARYQGTSIVLTLDPSHVDRLQIDKATFFIQKPVKDGILLQMCKLQFDDNESLNARRYDTVTGSGSNMDKGKRKQRALEVVPNSATNATENIQSSKKE